MYIVAICDFMHFLILLFSKQLSVHKDVTMVEHVQGQVFVVVEQVGQDTTVVHVSRIIIMFSA